MKWLPRQKVWLSVVILVNVTLWMVPSDVVEQIARDRHTMLGRYSRQHFTWNMAVALISLVSFYVDWSTGVTYRRRWFQVIATLLLLAPALAVVDFFLRPRGAGHYVRDQIAYHQPENSEFRVTYEDRPEAYRTFPDAPPGYGVVECAGRTDKHGFRNQTDFARYDVVVLGDSFVDGSRVSDEHVWPVRLARSSGFSVYNLGMSGYAPMHYRAAFERYGLSLRPRYVLCTLYEGNDFRSAKGDRKEVRPSLSKRLTKYFKLSPIISTLDRTMIATFGRMRCDVPVKGIGMLDWLPMAVPSGPDGKYYTFKPKQLRDLYQSREEFSRHKYWLSARGHLAEIKAMCERANCGFIVVYAPVKAHVLLPLVADDLPADKIRAFTALRYKGELPEPRTFLANLLRRIDARRSVVQEWCGREGIPFIDLTAALADAAMSGAQVYYTYDQHWTPDGHEVVAEVVRRFFERQELTAAGTGPRTSGTP